MALNTSTEELFFQWFVSPVEQRNNATLVFEINGVLDVERFLQACYCYLQHNLKDRLSIDYAYRTDQSDIRPENYLQQLQLTDDSLCIYDYIKQLVNRPYDFSSSSQPQLFLIHQSASRHYFVINTFHLEVNNSLARHLLQQIWRYSDSTAVSLPAEPQSVQAPAPTTLNQQEEARLYWRELLKGSSIFTALPVRQVEKARYQSHQFVWPAESVQQAALLSKQLNVDSYHLLCAAYSTSLALLIGQSGLLFSARRLDAPDLPSGLSALPLCCDLRSGPMQHLVQSMAQQCNNALKHNALSFYDIVFDQQQQTGVNRCFNLDFAEASLFEVDLGAEAPAIVPLPVPWNTADDYDVSLQFDRSRQDHWLFRLTYNNLHLSEDDALLLQQTMTRYLDALQLQLPAQSNTSVLAIHQVFAHTASLLPDLTAVVDGETRLSYQQLDQITDQLACRIRWHYLQKHQQPMPAQSPVAMMLERSWYGLAAMLAILKSGGCYVPVDPEFPAQRIDYILEDCQASLLISQHKLRHQAEHYNTSLLCIEDLLQQPAQSDTLPVLPDAASGLAYILYTSGTTGLPKGVMVEHRSAMNTITALKQLYAVPGSRIAAFTNFVFDVSVTEIFCSLLYGNELHLLQNQTRQDPHDLSRYLNEQRINLVYLPPAVLAVLPRIHYPALVSIIFAGEPCDQTVGRYFAERFALYNYYGPTEASIYVTGKRVDNDAVNDIGYALPQMRTYVLDEQLRPVAQGETGELYVSGLGLARGYLNKAEQTAASFIPNPFATAEERAQGFDRLYKTGDLVKARPDGCLKYLGRNDFQVKIQGFRIELGEIEAALSAIEEIGQSLVLVKERNNLKRLVAYYQALAPMEEQSLRSRLAERLPSYMLPHFFVGLQSFPLNTNGKIDRQRLPEPEWQQHVGAVAKDQSEQLVLKIWQQVLASDQFGVTEDFFLIGGDSLAAMQVVALLQQQGFACSTRLLYQHSTVRKLAQQLKSASDQNFDYVALDSKQLNEMQQLMINHQLITSPVIYNENISIDFNGMPLTEPQLRHALQRFIRHHAVLRMQVLDDYQHFVLAEVPEQGPELLTESFSAADFPTGYSQSLKHWVNLPFSLQQGPLYRFVLYYRDQQPAKLVFIHHHLISDGEAMYNIFVPALYALLKDSSAVLPPYPDRISRPVVNVDLKSLISQMHRVDLFHSLPGTDCQGDYLTHQFSESHSRQLESFARLHHVSLYALLQSLLLVLVYKFSGQKQISLGGVKSLRGTDAEAVYGNFLANDISNCLLDPGLGFSDFVRQRFADIQQNLDQVIPYQQLLELLRQQSGLDEKLPGIYMTVEPKAKFQLGWTLSQNDTLPRAVKYPLYFEFDHQQQLLLRLEFRTQMYSKTQARQLISAFTLLLEQVLAQPETPVHQLQVLPPAQIRDLLQPQLQQAAEPQQNLVQLWQQSAEQFADRTAVNSAGQSLSYRQLDLLANQLAHQIRQQINVKADTLIALLLPRGLDTVLSILAVLKAGAAYVPIDTSYPADRIAFMLQDTNTELVLTHQSCDNIVPEFSGQRLYLDQPDWQQQPLTPPAVDISPQQLAYVIYTSGSTGKPKGVLLEHQNICRLMTVTAADYQFKPQDVWCLFHSYVFDFSVWEMWGALAYGGRLFIPTKAEVQDTETFVRLCQQQQLTVLNQTPSAFYNFSAEAQKQQRLSTLRYVIFGGEALNLTQLRSWFDYYGDCQPLLVNMYGITETTVHVTYKAIRQQDISTQSAIGKPLADLQTYVLDEYLQPVPVGVIAELYISGAGLARGYLNRAELNKERFISNPYARPGHEFLYKSGDLVYLNTEGELIYTGRIDTQVKIRGYRIELGEIEAALSALPAVRQSLVIARQLSAGTVLVAYYLADTELDQDSLAAALASQLPPHMLPARYIQVDEFKLTVNGKLDKTALPEPDFSSLNYSAPQNELERQACQIWQEVLGVSTVGMQDDFFRMGGDSINSIKVVARLKELQLDISVRDIFEHRTLAALFRVAGKHSGQHSSYQPFELVSPQLLSSLGLDLSALDDAYPATVLQQGMFVESDRDAQVYHNIEVNQIPAAFELKKFSDIWQQLLTKHELLRASYLKLEAMGYLTLIHQKVLPESKIVFYDQYEQAYRQELATALDITEPGLFRLAVVQQEQQFQLLFTSHHAIEDGWSVASLLSEFIQAYMHQIPVQKHHSLLFAQFAKQELDALKDPQHRHFWQNYLADYQPANSNFIERQPDTGSPLLLESAFTLDPATSQALLKLAFEQSVSVDTVYLAAYSYLLTVFFNQDDITLGLVVNNRLELEGGDELFGLHLNTIPFRLKLNDSMDLLKATHQQRLQLLQHKVYPYGKIKADLALTDDIYQAAFNYIHFYQKHATLEKTGSELVDVLAITNIPLALVVSRDADSFSIAFQGHSSFIEQPYLELMAEHYLHYLQQLAGRHHIQQRLTPSEQLKVLVEHNQTARHYPQQDLLQWWYRSAQQHAQRLAVQDEEHSLSYQQLDQASNQLAQQLKTLLTQSASADSPVLVAILTERSADMLIAVLATLKAGAAYLPLDPAYPGHRIRYMLDDSGAGLLLTQRQLLRNLETEAPLQLNLCCIDDGSYQSFPAQALPLPADPKRLVNLIYTSGTTGKPKGVMINQHGLVNLVSAQHELLQLSQDDKVLQFASFSFDAASWEIFATLLQGATLVICPTSCKDNVGALLNLLEQRRVSVATLPPALLNVLEHQALPDLRLLIVAGEATPLAVMQRWSQNLVLINAYGPTETTVCSTLHYYQPGDLATTIGRPLPNLKCYVLDAQLQPVPCGVPGELFVSGAGVAAGYLRRSELTAQKFIANPYATSPAEQRLYRTGDRVRRLLDGSLDYLGRVDHQVKIRGNRVELSEIEAVLAEYPTVQQSAAVIRERDGQKYIAAYFTARAADQTAGSALVADWNKIYDAEYSKKSAAEFNQADFDGWNSSFDGKAIDLESMQEWRDKTVERIVQLKGRRILEIGSGAGLLFYPLLNHCDSYVATDFSGYAIDKLRHGAAVLQMEHKAQFVVCDAASVLQKISALGYQPDLIIINSVTQYFPSCDYLLDVLRQAMTLLNGQGPLFIGDVRDARLLDLLHYDIQKFQQPDAAFSALYAAAQQARLQDKELLIYPDFFLSFAKAYPQLAVDLQIKAGRHSSEMHNYRYDVTLTPQTAVGSAAAEAFYSPDALDLAQLLRQQSGTFVIRHYPNTRLYRSYLELHNLPAQSAAAELMDYQQLSELAAGYGYQFKASLEPDNPALVTLVFSREQAQLYSSDLTEHKTRPLHYAVREPFMPQNTAQLRAYLEQRLPAFMLPNMLIQLEAMPLTPNGKLDRKALPEPLQQTQGYVAPQTELEQALCQIWQDILGLSRVGVQDDFFQLGGNSILAISLTHRISKVLQRDISVATVFRHKTIAKLTEHGLGKEAVQIQPAVSGNKTLSYAQNRLWFLEQYEQGSSAYTIPLLLKLELTDTDWLKPALTGVLNRHQILRSVYQQQDDQTELLLLDAEALQYSSDCCTEAELHQTLKQKILTPFALHQELPIRAHLIRTEQQQLLLLLVHHIAFDGWSVDLLQNELNCYYQHLVLGQSLQLPELAIQYSDFANWQRQFLAQDELKRQLDYWLTQLQGFEPLQLPTSKARPKAFDYKGDTLIAALDPALSDRLRKLARQQQISLNSLMLAAFHLLLSKYSGQQDIVIGCPVANRHYQGTEALIGFFVNALPVRCRLAPAQPFSAFAKQVHQQLVSDQGHQDVPFELIVDALQVDRDSSRHPVFQVMFSVQGFGQVPSDWSNLQQVHQFYPVAKHDLTCFITEQHQQLSLELNYASSLFSADFIAQLADSYQHILLQLCQTPDLCLAEFDSLTPSQQHWLAEQQNQPVLPLKFSHLAEFWHYSVVQHPQHTALSDQDHSLSYQQLDTAANQLAQAILAQGALSVTPVIALLMNRSVEFFIALIASIKLGAAYLPLDSNQPKARLEFMLRDSQADLLLTVDPFNQLLDCEQPELNLNQLVLSSYSDQAPAVQIAPTDRAYILYTSGTTGQPKGVMISHQSVLNYISHGAHQSLTRSDVVDFSSSIAFDLSVTTMLAPLMLGCRIAIYSGSMLEMEAYRQHLRTQQVTFAKLVPSLAEQLVLDDAKLYIRTLMLGGEKLKPEQKQLLLQHCDLLLDEYGPTETTVGACLANVAIDQGIGRAYPNYRLYVLDSSQQPVPVGVWGELYIAGLGVALGYLNRPELNAERFIANPFSQDAAFQRLYRTGDLVRWLSSGELEYLSRNDHQVKLRGYRIETAEVEAALRTVPQVQQAVVLLRQLGTQQALVAWYVAAEQLDEQKLRDTVAALLPDYMQPGYYQWLSALPLTAHGKLDEKLLPAPDIRSQAFSPAENPLEHQLLAIWQPVLQQEQLGVEDDFFRSGGDSILSIQLVSRLRKAGLHLSVKELFEYRTVRSLARYLQQAKHKTTESQQQPAEGLFGLLPIQQRFFDQVSTGLIQQPHHWNQSFFIRVPELDLQRLQQAVTKLVQRHAILRTRFVHQQGQWQHCYQDSTDCTVLLIHEQDPAALQQQLNRLHQSLHLEKGPLFRLAYLASAEQTQLFFCCHHLLIDAVSWRIVLDDLSALYHGTALTPVTSSYQQWTEFVANYPDNFAEEAAYWQHSAERMVCYDQLPGIQAQTDVHLLRLDFSKALTQSLLQQANKAYQTEINDLLLTALARALQQWSGLSTVSVTLEGHGRQPVTEQLDLSHSLGWFTSLHPVHLQLSTPLGQSIRQVKQQLRQVPNKGLGFGAFERSLQLRLPAVQFNYLGVISSAPEHSQDQDQDSWRLQLDEISTGIAPSNTTSWLLDINGAVQQGQLFFEISSRLSAAQSQHFAGLFRQELTALIEHCVGQPEAGVLQQTPADYGVELTLEYYDQLLQQYQLDALYPATSLQKGFLSHALLHPEDDAYRVQFLIDYHQTLDTTLYRKAWQSVIRRFPVLRCSFDWQQQPVQLIHTTASAEFKELDFSQSAHAEQQLQQLQHQDRLLAFDLQQPCLLRLYLVKLGEAHYCLLRSEHHSISDGWSGPQLMKTLHSYYQMLLQGQEPQVQVQHSYLQSLAYYQHQHSACQRYWQDELSRIEEINDLSALYDQVQSHKDNSQQLVQHAGQIFVELPLDTLQQVTQQGITLSSVVQLVWHKLIASYTFAEQTIAGTTVSGRALPIEGIEDSVGLFINTLPLILDWNTEITVLDQLQQISHKVTAMNHWSFADLASLQRGRGALFQSILVFENYPSADEQAAVRYQYREAFEKVNYPLVLVAYQQDSSLALGLKYDTSLLSEHKARQLLSELQQLITRVPLALHQPHTELCVRQHSSHFCLQGPVQPLAAPDIVSWFEQVVRTYPDHNALYDEGQVLSYRQLNERSNQLAHQIRPYVEAQPNAADVVVALCLNKSASMIVAMLAVLKAGAAYLPIAPDAPVERLCFMLKDSQAVLLLSQQPQIKSIAESIAAPLCPVLDPDNVEPQPQSEQNLALPLSPAQLAYLIYTSGTTGQPKGVMTEHAGLVNISQSQQQTLAHGPESRVLQFSNYVFDASVFEIFPTLLSGACLYLLPVQMQNDVDALLDYLHRHQISSAFISTAVLKHLHGLQQTSLQNLYTGGESLAGLQQLPGCSLWNHYGPTEASVCALQSQVQQLDLICIGRPIQNMRAYLLDRWGKAAIPGAIAELYLSGVGLARGYLGLPELNQQKFRPNPFSNEPGFERLYPTGDLVRLAADGQLLYLSRRDKQIKIRGYRIELAEIEQQLLQHPAIEQALVVVLQLEQQQLLVAYYLSAQQLDPEVLKTQLSASLPDYMLPHAWVKLDKMPLTRSGKVDHQALPAPAVVKGRVQAGTATELRLCQLWQQSLGLAEPGVEDDFYQLGGDSILAIRLSQQIAEAFACTLTVSDFIRARTIRALAQIIEQQQQQSVFDSGEI